MELASLILLATISILLIYLFLIRNNINKLFRINLNKVYKEHYTLKNSNINIPELKASFEAFKQLNSELFNVVCFLIEEKNVLKEQNEKYICDIKQIHEEINLIKNELLIAKNANLQLKKEINTLKEA